MTTRLTNKLRDTIVDNALEKAGITKRVNDCAENLKLWGDEVRVFLLGGAVKAVELDKKRAQVQAIAKGIDPALRSTGDIFSGRSEIHLNMAGVRVRAKLSKYSIAPSSGTLLADNPLVQTWYDLRAEQEAAEKDHDNIRAQVRATVEKFGSVKRLIEAWPEAKELLPAVLPEKKPQLPALAIADLNKLVGLPSDHAAE